MPVRTGGQVKSGVSRLFDFLCERCSEALACLLARRGRVQANLIKVSLQSAAVARGGRR